MECNLDIRLVRPWAYAVINGLRIRAFNDQLMCSVYKSDPEKVLMRLEGWTLSRPGGIIRPFDNNAVRIEISAGRRAPPGLVTVLGVADRGASTGGSSLRCLSASWK